MIFLPVFALLLWGAVATTIDDFFLPGSQPGESGNLEHPGKCDNCHGGYDLAVEPAFNWRGSMMAQAQRDPLYLACLAIANQDAPESGDLCIRCHAPDGWLNGRSEPTDGSALNNNDREGVQCDFCHKLVKPTQIGVNPFTGDADYLAQTYQDDQDYLGTITMIPPQSGNGMYIAHSANAKRGPFVDAAAKHQMNYSPFHSESDICGTCHDVSNPVFTKNPDGSYSPNTFGAPSEDFDSYQMLPIERTFSEWKMSAYNTPEGVSSAVFGGNKANVSTCQDCHMMDVSGYGANKRGIPYRNDLPLHDMTGGNTFVPGLVEQLFPDEVNSAALAAGVDRATFMLQNAATMNLLVAETADGFNATVEVINETAHKLPSGYQEGRRIWINLRAYDIDGNLVFESGAYDQGTGVLTKEGTKIYEIKLGMSETVAAAASADGIKTYTPGESFHFVLNDLVVKDNRIPPRGFTNANFEAIQSPPVDYSYGDGQYWDNTVFALPSTTFRVVASLNYQTVSKEYVEFLRDENRTNTAGDVMYALWDANGKSAPVLMNQAEEYLGTQPVMGISATSATFTRISARGGRTYVSTLVSVEDDAADPVPGATVSGAFSGPTSNTVSGTTNSLGQVEFTSNSTKRASEAWCLDITNIQKTGYEFSGAVQFCEPAPALKSAVSTGELEMNAGKLRIFPNPASDLIHLSFSIPESQSVTIDMYDLSGGKIRQLHRGELPKGFHDFEYDLSHSPAGSYIIRLSYGRVIETKVVTIQ
jgi:hypothetical protein